MKRSIATFALMGTLAGLAVSSAAAAGGRGSQTLTATCVANGNVTVHASNGQSAWVNDKHWVVLRFTGTFTPVGGTPQTFTKVYGKKKGFARRTTDTCTGSQTSAGGTFTFTVLVAKTSR